ANLLVGVFNLLPGLPLDGGRMLRAGVWAASGRPLAGTVAAAWTGRALAAAVIALPFGYSWLMWRSAPSIFAILWTVLLGAFIWRNASAALYVARVRARLPRLVARDLARTAVAVTADTPLSEALRRRAAADAEAILVVDSAGTPTSLVDDAAADAVPAQRRPWLPVAHAARTLTPETVLPADLAGEELLDAMNARPAAQYLLVDADGTAVGALRTADVRRAGAGTRRGSSGRGRPQRQQRRRAARAPRGDRRRGQGDQRVVAPPGTTPPAGGPRPHRAGQRRARRRGGDGQRDGQQR